MLLGYGCNSASAEWCIPGYVFIQVRRLSFAWNLLQTVLLNEREQRLAYLLYHCGLGPREIIRCYPQEWSNAQEIYRLRHNILKRLLGIVEHQSMAGKAETYVYPPS